MFLSGLLGDSQLRRSSIRLGLAFGILPSILRNAPMACHLPFSVSYRVECPLLRQGLFLTNPITGMNFWWAQASTLIGKVDLVADPEDLPANIAAGNVYWGSFYLSGTIR